MNKFKQKEEERFALIVIDAFSRYAYIHPMKNKNSEDVLKASKATDKFRWNSAKNNKNPWKYC